MRELVFKNINAPSARKRDISVSEIVQRNGLVSTTEKRSLYFIRGAHRIKSKDELKKWVESRNQDLSLNKKFFHILRNHSDDSKEDKLICKTRGSFYILSDHIAYNIVFVHAIRIKIQKAKVEDAY